MTKTNILNTNYFSILFTLLCMHYLYCKELLYKMIHRKINLNWFLIQQQVSFHLLVGNEWKSDVLNMLSAKVIHVKYSSTNSVVGTVIICLHLYKC